MDEKNIMVNFINRANSWHTVATLWLHSINFSLPSNIREGIRADMMIFIQTDKYLEKSLNDNGTTVEKFMKQLQLDLDKTDKNNLGHGF